MKNKSGATTVGARSSSVATQIALHDALLEDAISDRDRSTSERGADAEARAVRALEAAGYLIVARNWWSTVGELDVVARDGSVLVFVEIRSRDDDAHGHAAEMVSRAKQRKVARVAEVYLMVERPSFGECRFDVVAVTGAAIEIIQDAWRA